MAFARFILVAVLTALTAATLWAADPPDFDRNVAPILAGRCLDCHSGPEPKGGLDLSTAKAAAKGGDSGESAYVARQPDKSPLWQRIAAGEMPPKHPLPEGERATMKAWIAAGATWGTDPIDPFRFTSASRAGYDWWSLHPLMRPAVPAIRNQQSEIRNPIDAFIISKLDERGLAPSPAADPRMLIRRLYFDLIGLPPSPEEVDLFVADSIRNPQSAIRNLTDRLLDSPHYGERWARHWLDVARYGESDGYEFDKMRPNAWRYRDWVIDALNRDLPYDEFARLQIAGDVLRQNDEAALTATGFLVAGPHDGLMPQSDTMRAVMRQDEVEDLVSGVSQTFLGLTVNCARCHDHKFDPVRQADYYRLAAALSGVKRGERELPPQEPPPALVERHKQASGELSQIESAAREAVLVKRSASASKLPEPPQPIARWEFDGDLTDSLGDLDATAHGGAKVESGALVLDGKQAYAVTGPLDRELSAKTLEVWLQLASLDQRGGGAIGVQTVGGERFDAIVFGEQEPRQWLAGSDFFKRTKAFVKAAEESDAGQRAIHLVIAYHADGRIAAYRNGQPYGEPYLSGGAATFEPGKSQVVFGLRHSPPGGNKMLAARIERASLYDRALSADEVAASTGTMNRFVSEEQLAAELDGPQRAKRESLRTESERLEIELKAYKERKAFAVMPQKAQVVHFLARGSVTSPGEAIAPGGVAGLAQSRPDFGLSVDAGDADRRRKLAEWIASEQNPLFARTIVNRLWHYHFGRGLVETTSDLGFSGGEPSHRDLLDWLAAELIARKWRLKEIHRLIVTSATYQQASQLRADCLAIDADNRLLWRYSPHRLEAEAVRDATLVLAGQFNPKMGGPSVMDFRPFVYKTTQYYEPLDPVGHEFNRRSIYRMWARGGKNPLLDTFDCPDPSTATPRRGATTTPLQALSLMNSSFTLRMADHFAERLQKDRPQAASAQVRRAFSLAYGREPGAEELRVSREFVERHGLPALCRVLLNANGFLYVD